MGRSCPLHRDGLINAWAVGVFGEERALAVILAYYLIAVVEEISSNAVYGLGDAPSEGVVGCAYGGKVGLFVKCGDLTPYLLDLYSIRSGRAME